MKSDFTVSLKRIIDEFSLEILHIYGCSTACRADKSNIFSNVTAVFPWRRCDPCCTALLKLLVGNAHFGDQIVHGLNVQLAGALEAESLVSGYAVFDFRDIDDRHIFLAAGTKFRLHSVTP